MDNPEKHDNLNEARFSYDCINIIIKLKRI